MMNPTKRSLRAFTGAAALAGSLLAMPAWAADLNVDVNQSRLHALSRSAATVIVGNPAIADVSISNANTLVVFGRAYGKTNLIALDENGGRIADLDINVVAPRDTALTLNRGSGQYSYNCAPRCERVIDPTDLSEDANALLQTTMQATGYADKSAGAANER